MAITSLLWNNGWSSQLSLSLDPPPSSDALCYAPSGGLLMEKNPSGISEMLLKGCGYILYSSM